MSKLLHSEASKKLLLLESKLFRTLSRSSIKAARLSDLQGK